MQLERLYVHPSFKKAVKIKAAEEGISICEWTEQVVKNTENPLDELSNKLKKQSGRRYGFDFP